MLLQKLSDPDVFGSFNELQKIQNQLTRLLTAASKRSTGDFPPANVWTNETGAIVRCEMPGIDISEMEITVVNDTLTIKGEKCQIESETQNSQNIQQAQNCLRQERGWGRFTRSLQLPFAVDAEQVKANYADGILQLTLPRAEADKPRRITVSEA
ncbi:MAG: Hsp20/alpha crystallin family protein [Candidatus Obscuribacterales bacterium]|nr:Hsp20/alpha crystallin family protein [Candidatus Obscuribacterales bacterium]